MGIIPPFSKAGLEMVRPLSGVGIGERKVGVGEGIGDKGAGVGLAGWHETAKSTIITKRKLFFSIFTSLSEERAFGPFA